MKQKSPSQQSTIDEEPASGSNKTNSGSKGPQNKFDKNHQPEEFGGRSGPDPTRYGDWEKDGRCVDF